MKAASRLAVAALAVALLPSLPGYLRRGTAALPPGIAQLTPDTAQQYRPVGFEQLSSLASVPGGGETLEIPEAIRILDGTRVAVRGYVIPIAYEGAGVTQLLLAARNDLGCCFGVGMRATEWVRVTWSAGALESAPEATPVTLLGRFHVRPEIDGDGTLQAIYEMEGERLLP